MNNKNPNLKIGDTLNGFRVIRQEFIPTLQLVFYELRHQMMGTRMVHLSSDDPNKVFMATFPTHPSDSTGVAHILEHGVLEGSRSYPVKIFKNLSGRSVNTFLNAMTSSDYTAYPFASCNMTDFMNVMDVYLDASFFPLLSKNTFLQEGWRYEFTEAENPDSQLAYRGVVYNEMKGAMGNPVRLFYEYTKKAVFPDLTYAYASGGDPAAMPELTYENWTRFHSRFYHPSNAIFFTYGDISLHILTEKIQEKVLRHFTPSKPVDPVPIQKSYSDPQKIHFTYPVSASESTEKKSFIAVIWKLLPITDFLNNLRLELLHRIIAGDTSSILNRTLLSSGLGKGLAPIGYENSFTESYLGTGLKDVSEADADRIEQLVIDTLRSVADQGFSEQEINAAIHELEFQALEIKGDHGVPFGLSLLFRGMKPFMDGADFAESLKIHDVLETLRREAVNPGFFSQLIRTYLLDNPHRVTMILSPESGAMEALETKRRAELDQIQNTMTEEEKVSIIEQSRVLKNHQLDDGDTSCLPSIDLDDISRLPEEIPQRVLDLNGIPLYLHPIPTNGITYMTVNFRTPVTDAIPLNALQFAGILPELGAGGRNYIEMSRLIKQYTGGISVSPFISRDVSDRNWVNLQVTGRCLPRNHKILCELMADLMLSPDLTHVERIQELLNMQKAYAVPTALHQGHRMAMLAAGKSLSAFRWIEHNTSGMQGIRRLLGLRPADLDQTIRSLQTYGVSMCRPRFENIGVTGLDDHVSDALTHFPAFQGKLADDTMPSRFEGPTIPTGGEIEPEAWVFSTDVSYVAQAFNAAKYEHPDAPILTVLSALMEKPLYERIRARSGAYGAFASFDSTAGIFSMLTYRDPHTVQSLDSFSEVIRKFAGGNFTKENIHHAVINVISNLDTPPSPREKGLIALKNRLAGITFEDRAAFRQGVIGASRDDIVRVVETYLVDPERTGIAIVTSDKILHNDETRQLNLKRLSVEHQTE